MGFNFEIFGDANLSEEFVEWLVRGQWYDVNNHFSRLWDYYQNSTDVSDSVAEGAKRYVQAQEAGLPGRITGASSDGNGGAVGRKEVVIENDIAWRVNALVDFLFGKDVSFINKSPNEGKRREIEKIINAVFAANGGIGFFQDMAVLGSVYGFVDCFVRPSGSLCLSSLQKSTSKNHSFKSILEISSQISLELIEATRALPVLDENDYRKINYYVQNFHQQKNRVSSPVGFLSRLIKGRADSANRESILVTEIVGAEVWQRYENTELVSEGVNPLGRVPVVHIQNVAQPYYYEGASDVEPLIPLQDELNTRLSDRASRVTFQSFKMYLAKGIEGFEDRPVSPGRMWSTDNVDASVEQFGGDGSVPSEDNHIAEIREAMDKTSSVSPVVAGVLKDRVGNLTSAVALRMTLMGMLAKTERKKFTYGQGLKRVASMVLELLDKCGVYSTDEEDREFELIFPNPLPDETRERLEEAKMKKELGVSQEQVLRELGYENN